MKKTILIAALLVGMTSSAFAATTFSNAPGGTLSGTTINGVVFNPSSNVTLIAESDLAHYTAISGHLNGDKQFTSTSSEPDIIPGTKAKGTAVAEADMPALPTD